MDERAIEVTRLLREGQAGEEQLLPLVYDELRALARGRLADERSGHTLQATALVNEAWMRLAGDRPVPFEGRRHFYAAAGEAMRRVLIDHARRLQSQKRGGDRARVTLGSQDEPYEFTDDQLLAVHEALTALETEDPRASEVARLRFLSGLSNEETAQTLGLSVRSVEREWAFARARLFALLGGEHP